MNRRLDGEILTTDDLVAIAVEHGLLTPEQVVNLRASHNGTLVHGSLLHKTRNIRFELLQQRKLLLNTATPRNTPDQTEV